MALSGFDDPSAIGAVLSLAPSWPWAPSRNIGALLRCGFDLLKDRFFGLQLIESVRYALASFGISLCYQRSVSHRL